LPNRKVRKPTKGERTKDEEEKERIFLKFANDRAKDLFYKANDILLALDERVWRNFGEKYTSYYSPERVFTY